MSSIARIRTPAVEPVSEAVMWERRATQGQALRPLNKACHDCAVVSGLYREIAESLANQLGEIVESAALRWFCHNNPNRACAGNIAYQASQHAEPVIGGEDNG